MNVGKKCSCEPAPRRSCPSGAQRGEIEPLHKMKKLQPSREKVGNKTMGGGPLRQFKIDQRRAGRKAKRAATRLASLTVVYAKISRCLKMREYYLHHFISSDGPAARIDHVHKSLPPISSHRCFGCRPADSSSPDCRICDVK